MAQSDTKAQQAGKELDQKTDDGLKLSYDLLRKKLAPGELAELSPASPGYDSYIDNLRIDIAEGKSARSKHILNLLRTDPVFKQMAPNAADELQNYNAIRKAAVDAVNDNSQGPDFLQGASWGNALSGVGNWLTDGKGDGFFSKLFQLIGYVLGKLFGSDAPMPDGLKEAIGSNVVSDTVSSFKKNLQAEGVDTSQGYGQEVVQKFDHEAKIKAGLLPPDPVLPVPGATPAPNFGAVGDVTKPEALQDELTKHFQTVGNQISTYLPPGNDKLVAAAKEAFTTTGVDLAQKAIKEGKPIDLDALDFQVAKQSFEKIKKTLDDDKDKSVTDEQKALIGNVVTAFNNAPPGATLQSVADSLQRSGDTALAGVFIEHSVQPALSEGHKHLLEIAQKANPGNAGLQAQAQQLPDAPVAATPGHASSDPKVIEGKLGESKTASLLELLTPDGKALDGDNKKRMAEAASKVLSQYDAHPEKLQALDFNKDGYNKLSHEIYIAMAREKRDNGLVLSDDALRVVADTMAVKFVDGHANIDIPQTLPKQVADIVRYHMVEAGKPKAYTQAEEAMGTGFEMNLFHGNAFSSLDTQSIADYAADTILEAKVDPNFGKLPDKGAKKENLVLRLSEKLIKHEKILNIGDDAQAAGIAQEIVNSMDKIETDKNNPNYGKNVFDTTLVAVSLPAPTSHTDGTPVTPLGTGPLPGTGKKI